MTTKTKIIKIGNSRGVRIPKALLEQANLNGEVELEVREGKLVVHAVARPRAGWDEDLAAMAREGEDAQLIPELENDWDEDGWEW